MMLPSFSTILLLSQLTAHEAFLIWAGVAFGVPALFLGLPALALLPLAPSGTGKRAVYFALVAAMVLPMTLMWILVSQFIVAAVV